MNFHDKCYFNRLIIKKNILLSFCLVSLIALRKLIYTKLNHDADFIEDDFSIGIV